MHLHPLLKQIRALGRSAETTEERVITERVSAAKLRVLRRTPTSPERVGLSWEATERGEAGLPRRKARHDPPATNASAAGGPRRAHEGHPEAFFLWLDRSHEMRHRKSRGGSRRGRRHVRGHHERKDRPVTPENVLPLGNITEDPTAVRLRYRVGRPSPATVGDTLAIIDFGQRRDRGTR